MGKKDYLCSMKQMFKILSVYGIAYFLLLMLVFGLQFVYPKLELHLLLNSHHTVILDFFFKYYSVLAEWPLYILMLLPLLWKKYSMTIFFAISELSAGAVLQILKHFISAPRPASAFEHYQNITLPMVEGVNMHYGNSFPSGHASTFFVFCTCTAIILAYRYQQNATQNDPKTKILINLFLLSLLVPAAALGAYSRIYLSQHFLSDVCVGSIIGFVTPWLVFYFGRNKILKLKMNET